MSPRVLVADDSRTQQALTSAVLRAGGFEPVVVPDGLAAASALLADDGPSLAILDWQMPALDGPDVARLVRLRSPPGLRYLIVLTATSDPAAARAALKAGADAFICKPCAPAELIERLRVGVQALAEHSAHVDPGMTRTVA